MPSEKLKLKTLPGVLIGEERIRKSRLMKPPEKREREPLKLKEKSSESPLKPLTKLETLNPPKEKLKLNKF